MRYLVIWYLESPDSLAATHLETGWQPPRGPGIALASFEV